MVVVSIVYPSHPEVEPAEPGKGLGRPFAGGGELGQRGVPPARSIEIAGARCSCSGSGADMPNSPWSPCSHAYDRYRVVYSQFRWLKRPQLPRVDIVDLAVRVNECIQVVEVVSDRAGIHERARRS